MLNALIDPNDVEKGYDMSCISTHEMTPPEGLHQQQITIKHVKTELSSPPDC